MRQQIQVVLGARLIELDRAVPGQVASSARDHLPGAESGPCQQTPSLLIELTTRWALSRRIEDRPELLRDLAAWFDHCEHPLSATPAEILDWLHATTRPGTYDRGAPLYVVERRRRVVTSWYRILHEHRLCRRNPAAGLCGPHPPSTGWEPHSVRSFTAYRPVSLEPVAFAVVVEYALQEAHENGYESNWRDAAVLAASFYLRRSVADLVKLGIKHLTGVGASVDADDPMTLWLDDPKTAPQLLPVPAAVSAPLRRYLFLRAARHGTDPRLLNGPLFAADPAETRPDRSDPTTEEPRGDTPWADCAQRIDRLLARASRATGVSNGIASGNLTADSAEPYPRRTPTLPPIQPASTLLCSHLACRADADC
ncbi:hypothetical protein ETD83_12715 [Actinomadura soli]|uniref:Integrase n=1 Tax=Actinomadura soli TaxID=2508997 RepID=A0A5C4JDU7_9ACTN|nr:hypothetical protein [Actinomadura soli]TMR02401.1 hypothetical protein ETD83_12715 [Actinomadura soli]